MHSLVKKEQNWGIIALGILRAGTMGEHGAIEKLFIRILNRSLLVGCVLLLAGALAVALLAGINFVASTNPAVDHTDIVIAYVPLPPVLPRAPSTEAESDTSGRVSPEDLKLMRMATPGCQALGKFASIITNQRLDFHGAGLTVCEQAQLQTAKSFGEREMNYLSVFSTSMDQLARDPHVAANYGSVSDDDAKAAVDAAVNDFASKFKAAIEAQNTKNLDAQADAISHRIQSMTLLGVAGAAFLSFLFIAFLIVFLRIEQHLDVMSVQKRPL